MTDEDIDYMPAASSGDCTGLIPAGNPSEDELENYSELEHFEPPKSKKKTGQEKKKEHAE